MNPTNYPLTWPVGWKRTPGHRREAGRFSTKDYGRASEAITVAGAVDRLLAELLRMAVGQDDVIISSNVQPTLTGRPRSGERKPTDPGVAVYWRDMGKDRCMAIDRYSDVAQNIAALAATIEAMRAIERHGGAAILDRAFTGFTALPAPIVAGMKRPWREVFDYGFGKVERALIDKRYRQLASQYHTDRPDGDHDKMAELNVARDEALQEVSP
ncbi:hypothetical protein [Polaromonas sp.]|uniref:J domain-containing protein n=1 Tax=Polaromonas sp. TaxID=1869339 RepID=UPI0032654695